VLPQYLECLKAQKLDSETKCEYLYVDGGSTDGTVRLLHEFGAKVLRTPRRDGHSSDRCWTKERLRLITKLKNEVLYLVRYSYKPDFFFCLDSDILLQSENCIQRLVDDDKDAVSPISFTDPQERTPNLMQFRGSSAAHLKKSEIPGDKLFEVDILLSAILMSRRAYSMLDYQYHHIGEEVGFAILAKEKGFKMWCDSRVKARHVWDQEKLR